MKKYIIGIDTGGTYTDAALIEAASGAVIATVKEPTTHYHLATGTGKVLATLLRESGVTPADIGQLAVSTTLATNAVVEKKGARVGLFVIGFVKHFRLPVVAVVFIKGGHTITGAEEEPLDLENLVDKVLDLAPEVDAYAVCSAMSVENPTHELVAEKAIAMIDPKPVFCSHRISDQAGMRERAATAALHAKLMPLMQEYIAGVQVAMIRQGLSCPVVIIGGNAKAVTIDQAVERAAMTVASGPACTAHFGALQTSGDALVIDVGGTTTDIAIVEKGQPQMAANGCQIGEWQTLVEAVDMFTSGIGGDSWVGLDEQGSLRIGPTRVQPLCMATAIPPASQWLGAGARGRCLGLVREEDAAAELTAMDDPIVSFLRQNGPASPAAIAAGTGLSSVPLEKRLENLIRAELIVEAGFTPTDALLALDRIAIGDKGAAINGAKVLAGIRGVTVEALCQEIVRHTEKKIEDLIIDYIIHRYWGKSLTSFISSRECHPVLGVQFSLKIPLIGIGAAARYFLPAIAQRLGTTVSFPEHCEVGNAVGAAMLGRSYSSEPRP